MKELDQELYEDLRQQSVYLDEAIEEGSLAEMLEHRDAMRRGWQKANEMLEERELAVARAAGFRPLLSKAKPNPFAPDDAAAVQQALRAAQQMVDLGQPAGGYGVEGVEGENEREGNKGVPS